MEQDRQITRFLSAQLLVALMVGGAYVLYDQPFESNRTPSGESTDMFETRLWEDPLNTIYNIKAIEEQQLVSGNNQGIGIYLENLEIDAKRFSGDVTDAVSIAQSDGLTVIGVMMQEGQYSLTIETRRRIRYAVISALNQSKIPMQSERLSVVQIESGVLDVSGMNLISYEIFQPYVDFDFSAENQTAKTTVVLWIPANLLSGNVVENYQKILGSLGLTKSELILTSNPESRLASSNLAISKAILLGPTSSNELVDMYYEYSLSKSTFSEIDEPLTVRESPAEESRTEDVLSILEIADGYLDYGLPLEERLQLEVCLFNEIQVLNEDMALQCLEQRNIVDSDASWHQTVVQNWINLRNTRQIVIANGIPQEQADLITDLVESADWYLDEGFPEDQVGDLAVCMNSAPDVWELEWVSNCLQELPISDSDSTWFDFIAKDWMVLYALEGLFVSQNNDEELEARLKIIIQASDDYLDWGFETEKIQEFVSCVQNLHTPQLVNRESTAACLRGLNIKDSDSNWISFVLDDWPPGQFFTLGPTERSALQIDPSADQTPAGPSAPNDEGADSQLEVLFPRDRIIVLSPRATIPDPILRSVVELRGKFNYQSKVKSSDVIVPGLYRTLDSDEELLTAIKTELLLRGLKLNDSRIALVYEGDGKYGRALQQILDCSSNYNNKSSDEKLISGNNEPGSAAEDSAIGSGCFTQVDSFSYLRGLDGIRPEDTNTKALNNGNTSLESISSLLSASESLEQSFGRHQYDYLRRLSDELSRNSYAAIGVLGTDIYDKLLVLQALREKNRHAVFFTTDLDATALHADQFGWTQNLLVASALPLSLDESVDNQGNSCKYLFSTNQDRESHNINNAPPFRESYQTAYFQSVCLALYISEQDVTPSEQDIRNLISSKLLGKTAVYEMGRTTPVLLRSGKSASNSQDSEETASLSVLSILRQSLSWLLLMLPTIMLFLLSSFAWNRERARNNSLEQEISNTSKTVAGYSVPTALAASSLLCLGTILFMSILLITEAMTVGGEPLRIIEGVSHWPTTLLRIQVLIFGITFGLYSYARWAKSTAEIEELVIEDSTDNDADDGVQFPRSLAGWNYLIESQNEKQETSKSIAEIWKIYRALGTTGPRLRRVIPKALTWSAIVYGAYFYFTPHPALIRDSFWLADILFGHGFVLLVTVVSLLMISLANDVTNLSRIFVKALGEYKIIWRLWRNL